jgi:hypothetical protein
MSSPVNELSQVTNASELSNLLEDDKFSILSVFTLAEGNTINDGATEASVWIKTAVDYAVTNGIGKIVFPYGTYLCDNKIFDDDVIPEGIEFIASGKFGGLDSAEGVIIKYTGSDICFDFQEDLGTEQVGGISFDGFCFQATHIAGGMFAFNDVTALATDDNTTQNYIRNIKFKRCIFRGNGSVGVTGNAIQGLKVFEMHIDSTCEFTGWKRAVYLNNCDNNIIEGRFYLNVRHIHAEDNGSFGTSLVVDSRFLGPIIDDGVGLTEAGHQLYIDARYATIINPTIEGDAGTGSGNIYINSECVRIDSPMFATIGDTWLQLGSEATDVEIVNPRTTGGTSAAIVYATPTYWDWSGTNQAYRVTITNPSTRFERWLTPHPQLKIISPYNFIETYHKGNSILDATGESIERFTLTAFNLERATYIGGYTGFISGVNVDTSSFNGYSVAIPASTGSFVLKLVVGKDIPSTAVVHLKVRYKNDDTPGSGSLRYVVQNNGANVTNGAIAVSTSYTMHTKFVAATGVNGDVLTFGVYNTSDKLARVSAIEVECSSGNARWGTVAPTSGFHFNGEMVRNAFPTTVTNIEYWRCITEGTPGTWKAYGSGRGTTAERPSLASGDDGYSYYDTNSNKMIMWNGSAWLV